MTPRSLPELRLRTKVSESEIESKVGKILTPEDVNVVLGGRDGRDAKILKPDGSVLAIYRRGIIPQALRDATYPILQTLKAERTTNRGLASGTPRVQGPGTRSYAMNVPSALLGGFEPQGPRKFCRLTAWTGRETERYRELWPLFEFIGERMMIDAPDRYANQMTEVARTHPDWVIPGTPFSTITVNNTFATGVHRDAGDLKKGLSTLACFRQGDYNGGILCFPEYRLGVDMQDRDLLLMDADEWHGNTGFDPPCPRDMHGNFKDGDPGYERISLVCYFREKIVACDAAADEAEKRRVLAEHRAEAAIGL